MAEPEEILGLLPGQGNTLAPVSRLAQGHNGGGRQPQGNRVNPIALEILRVPLKRRAPPPAAWLSYAVAPGRSARQRDEGL